MLKFVVAIAAAAVVFALAAPELASRLTKAVDQTGQETVSASETQAARVMLSADRRGHFEADVTINGRPLTAIVDTGASAIALTYEDGRALGLIRPGDRFDVEVKTANGTTGAKRVSLNSVRLGGISVSNVEAIVAQEGALGANLLGMSFLNRVRSFEIRNGRLLLEQ